MVLHWGFKSLIYTFLAKVLKLYIEQSSLVPRPLPLKAWVQGYHAVMTLECMY